MKIMLLGSLISAEAIEELNSHSKEVASVAPVNYETMLAKGLVENGAQVDAISVPAVAAYPNSIYKTMDARVETVLPCLIAKWVPFTNIQGLKQMTIKRNVYRMLKCWLEENRHIKDKMVMMYSIYPPYTGPAQRLCKKYGCHLNVVITDLPEYMYSWKKSKGLRSLYARYLQKQMLKQQTGCDSYILFTEKMAARMSVETKPYMVSEGFSDSSVFASLPPVEKYEKKTIVYGGNLSKLYGIRALVDGFMLTTGDYELHLYGAGIDSAYIQQCAKKDTRIRFFGRVTRNELLLALKKAHLLVINKPTADDYSNYSFSSKILEYMVSGTPVLTTRVGGMPVEYYDYFYFIDDESPEGIAETIEKTLNKSDLRNMGEKARKYACKEKNYCSMTKKILTFLNIEINTKI